MPHRRKPKFSGPPGLALPEMTPEVSDGSSATSPRKPPRADERQGELKASLAATFGDAVASLVREAVASEMEDVRSRLDDARQRLERMELLLFRASFEDFDRIDRFISEAKGDDEQPPPALASRPEEAAPADGAPRSPPDRCGAPTKPQAVAEDYEESASCCTEEPLEMLQGEESATCCTEEPLEMLQGEESASCCTEEPLEMLQGMACASAEASCPILLHPSCLHGAAAGPGAEKSLHARREARRDSTQKLVARARLACKAEATVGQMGTLEDLHSLLSVGSLLESTSFMDVLLRGPDGVRMRTAGPVIKVTHVQGQAITFTDGSPQPAVDRRGRPVFGQTTMSDEVFCIVGHSKLGGAQMAYAELMAGK